MRFKANESDEFYIFDVLKRQLIPESAYREEFNSLPPITSTLDITDWKDSTNFKLDGQYFPMKQYEKSKVIAIHPDNTTILSGTDWHLRYYDDERTVIWKKHAPSITYYVNFVNDCKQTIAYFADGTFRWYRTEDGENLLNLFVNPQTHDWVLWTQNGYYCCSENADKHLKWRLNSDDKTASEVYAFSRYSEKFHNTLMTVQTLFENKTDVELLQERNQTLKKMEEFQAPLVIRRVNSEKINDHTIQIVVDFNPPSHTEKRNDFSALPVVLINGKNKMILIIR